MRVGEGIRAAAVPARNPGDRLKPVTGRDGHDAPRTGLEPRLRLFPDSPLDKPLFKRKCEEVVNGLTVSRIGRMNSVGFPALTVCSARAPQSGGLLDQRGIAPGLRQLRVEIELLWMLFNDAR